MAEPYLGVYDASSSSSDDEKQERGRKRHPHTRRYYESIRLQRIKGGASNRDNTPSQQHEPLSASEPIDAGADSTVSERQMIAGRRFIVVKPLGEEERDEFTFFPPGKGPEIKHKGTKERAKKAILAVYNELAREDEQKPTCWDRLCCTCARNEDETKLSPLLQKVSSQGFNMLKMVFFPSMPALLQDLWVYLELLISVFAFVFGFINYSTGTGTQRIFNIVYLVLAIIGMIFSLIDGFIYIFYVGVCARFIRKHLKSRKQRQRQESEDGEGGENNEGQRKRSRCPPQLPKKWLTRFNQFFEIGRNLLSELLLYPLLICDLFDFIALGGSQPENAEDRTNFGLFCIGSFYLVLAVYIMRIVTVVGTMVSMLRLPLQATGGQKQYIQLMARFCFHALRQIFVHLLIVLAVAAKIRNENPQALDDEDPINISPFLWSAIFLGWIVPLAGVLVFFVVNYYWTKEFSISFWVDMISLLQGQSFAEAVFGGEGISAQETAQHVAEKVETKTVTVVSPEAKQKTLDLVEKSRLKEVKKQLKRFKSPSFLTKFFHPVKLPLLGLAGLLYDACLTAFMVSLTLTFDGERGVYVALSDDSFLLAAYLLVMIFALLANLHLLILVNISLSIILFLFIPTTVYMLVSIPYVALVYTPIAGMISCFQCWIRITRRSAEFSNDPGVKPRDVDLELRNDEKQGTQLHHDIGPVPRYIDPELQGT